MPNVADCPFCGESYQDGLIALPEAKGQYDSAGNVICLGCGASGPIRDAAGQRADAIERWNTRVSPSGETVDTLA